MPLDIRPGNFRTIARTPASSPSIEAPGGQIAKFTVDGSGYPATIATPARLTMHLVASGDGLLGCGSSSGGLLAMWLPRRFWISKKGGLRDAVVGLPVPAGIRYPGTLDLSRVPSLL